MFYDCVRIIGLKISSELDRCLIKLHNEPQNLLVKQALIRTLIDLCWNTKLLK